MGFALRRVGYRARKASRLRGSEWRQLAGLSCVIFLACASAGCSYRLGGLFGSDDEAPEHTGSVSQRGATAPADADNDLALARQAAADLLARADKASSLPWENPATGARGTVTALADAYTQDGLLCRDFLASYIRGGRESWMQGGACRMHQGKWEVRDLRPWKRS